MRGASPVDQTGGALFFSPVLPISVEKGKQRHNQAAKGHQQSQYPNKNRDDLISRHKRPLPSYVFRQAGSTGPGGYHPVMGTLPWGNYSRGLQNWQPGFQTPGSMLALKNNVIIMSRRREKVQKALILAASRILECYSNSLLLDVF